MNNVLKIAVNVFSKKNTSDTTEYDEKMSLIADIREISQNLDNAYKRFEFESDSDLIEASIYEIESLKARYRHLLQKVKNIDANSSDRQEILKEIRHKPE